MQRMAMIDGGGRATEHEQHCRMYEVRLQVNRIHICVVMISVLSKLSIGGVVIDMQRMAMIEADGRATEHEKYCRVYEVRAYR